MGVDMNQTIALTFLLGGALAAAAGVVWDLRFGYVRQDLGFNAGLKAFTAAVLGGIGNITGAVLGGFVIGFVENFASADGLSRWSEFARVHGPDVRPDLPAVGHPRPADRGPGMTIAAKTRPVTTPPRGFRSSLNAFGTQHRSVTVIVGMLIVTLLMLVLPRFPPLRVDPAGRTVVRLVRERRRLRPPGDGPERRHRHGRPARPRLCGVLRDRRLHLRLQQLAVLGPQPAVLPDARRRGRRRGGLRHPARRTDTPAARRLPRDHDPRLRRDRPDRLPEPRPVHRRNERDQGDLPAGDAHDRPVRRSAHSARSRRCRTSS